MDSFSPENAQSDAIATDHADALTFLREILERDGGVLPAYDSTTWTVAQYEGAFGRSLEPEEAASARGLLNGPASFRTVPGLVGRPLASQPAGTLVLNVRGRTPGFTLRYDVDRDLKIVGSLLT